MAEEIDVRGLSCPQPVILVKKAIDAGKSEIVVIANDSVSTGNIQRLAENNGYIVEIQIQNDNTVLRLKKI